LAQVEGDVFVWPNLAKTLRRIAQNGAQEFYSGQVGQELVEDLQKAGSIITMEDLKNYRLKTVISVSGSSLLSPLLVLSPLLSSCYFLSFSLLLSTLSPFSHLTLSFSTLLVLSPLFLPPLSFPISPLCNSLPSFFLSPLFLPFSPLSSYLHSCPLSPLLT